MTILCRIEPTGDNHVTLTVCGTPTKAWLDWLLTAEVGLTAEQIWWRELHRRETSVPPSSTSVAPRTEETKSA